MKKRRKCPVCGVRNWHKDAITGILACEEGHILQGVRSENLVSENTGHAMQKRRLTRGPRENKREIYGQRDQNLLHGPQGEMLRLQGLQLMLRHQVYAIKRLWSLPDAFEIVVRDLWAYQLHISPMPELDLPRSPSPSPPPPPSFVPKQSYSQPAEVTYGSESDTDTEKEEAAQEVPLEGAKSGSDLSGQVSEDSETDEEILEKVETDPDDIRARKRTRLLGTRDTLICIVLGLWIMRTPFTYKKIESVVNTNQIPYIEFAKSTLVPAEMYSRMNQQRFTQTIPEINVPPVAWHVISSLGGSRKFATSARKLTPIATTYFQTMRFLALTDANMSLVPELETYTKKRPNSENTSSYLQAKRFRDVFMPELLIAAAWVVVMKLAYGLDGDPRLALMPSDPIIGLPKGDLWVAELKRRILSGELKGDSAELEPQRFDLMPNDDLDAFLDRCEDVLLKNRRAVPSHQAREMVSQFPLSPRPEKPLDGPAPDSWADFHEDVIYGDGSVELASPDLAGTESDDLPQIPGEDLRTYDASDLTGTLPRDLEVVVTAAADVVGVTPLEVLRVVEVLERKMERRRPRREYKQSLAPRCVAAQPGPGLRPSSSSLALGSTDREMGE